MKTLHVAILSFLVMSFAPACIPPGPVAGGLINWPNKAQALNCVQDEVRTQAEASLEDVLQILSWEDFADVEHWKGPAKNGFIDIAKKIGKGGIDAVLCMIGWKEQQFTAGATSNPNDTRAALMRDRARAMLHELGYTKMELDGEPGDEVIKFPAKDWSGASADSM
jgi:hypothetical protein